MEINTLIKILKEKLTIESSELRKISSIEANRKIYGVLKDEMNRSIHSLQIIIV